MAEFIVSNPGKSNIGNAWSGIQNQAIASGLYSSDVFNGLTDPVQRQNYLMMLAQNGKALRERITGETKSIFDSASPKYQYAILSQLSSDITKASQLNTDEYKQQLGEYLKQDERISSGWMSSIEDYDDFARNYSEDRLQEYYDQGKVSIDREMAQEDVKYLQGQVDKFANQYATQDIDKLQRILEAASYDTEERTKQEAWDAASGATKAWQTIANLALTPFEALGEFAEGLVDVVAQGIGSIGYFFGEGGREFAKNTQDFVAWDLISDTWVSSFTPASYTSQYASGLWADVSKFAKDAESSLVQMLPMALNIVVPGLGTAIYYAGMAGQTAEGYAQQAAARGHEAPIWETTSYTMFSTAIEVATENMFDSPIFGPGGLSKTLHMDTMRNPVLRTLLGGLGEGAEEVVAEIADGILDKIYTGETDISFQSVVRAGALGAVNGWLIAGVNEGKNAMIMRKIALQVKSDTGVSFTLSQGKSIILQDYLDRIRYAIDNGKKVSEKERSRYDRLSKLVITKVQYKSGLSGRSVVADNLGLTAEDIAKADSRRFSRYTYSSQLSAEEFKAQFIKQQQTRYEQSLNAEIENSGTLKGFGGIQLSVLSRAERMVIVEPMAKSLAEASYDNYINSWYRLGYRQGVGPVSETKEKKTKKATAEISTEELKKRVEALSPGETQTETDLNAPLTPDEQTVADLGQTIALAYYTAVNKQFGEDAMAEGLSAYLSYADKTIDEILEMSEATADVNDRVNVARMKAMFPDAEFAVVRPTSQQGQGAYTVVQKMAQDVGGYNVIPFYSISSTHVPPVFTDINANVIYMHAGLFETRSKAALAHMMYSQILARETIINTKSSVVSNVIYKVVDQAFPGVNTNVRDRYAQQLAFAMLFSYDNTIAKAVIATWGTKGGSYKNFLTKLAKQFDAKVGKVGSQYRVVWNYTVSEIFAVHDKAVISMYTDGDTVDLDSLTIEQRSEEFKKAAQVEGTERIYWGAREDFEQVRVSQAVDHMRTEFGFNPPDNIDELDLKSKVLAMRNLSNYSEEGRAKLLDALGAMKPPTFKSDILADSKLPESVVNRQANQFASALNYYLDSAFGFMILANGTIATSAAVDSVIDTDILNQKLTAARGELAGNSGKYTVVCKLSDLVKPEARELFRGTMLDYTIYLTNEKIANVPTGIVYGFANSFAVPNTVKQGTTTSREGGFIVVRAKGSDGTGDAAASVIHDAQIAIHEIRHAIADMTGLPSRMNIPAFAQALAQAINAADADTKAQIRDEIQEVLELYGPSIYKNSNKAKISERAKQDADEIVNSPNNQTSKAWSNLETIVYRAFFINESIADQSNGTVQYRSQYITDEVIRLGGNTYMTIDTHSNLSLLQRLNETAVRYSVKPSADSYFKRLGIAPVNDSITDVTTTAIEFTSDEISDIELTLEEQEDNQEAEIEQETEQPEKMSTGAVLRGYRAALAAIFKELPPAESDIVNPAYWQSRITDPKLRAIIGSMSANDLATIIETITGLRYSFKEKRLVGSIPAEVKAKYAIERAVPIDTFESSKPMFGIIHSNGKIYDATNEDSQRACMSNTVGFIRYSVTKTSSGRLAGYGTIQLYPGATLTNATKAIINKMFAAANGRVTINIGDKTFANTRVNGPDSQYTYEAYLDTSVRQSSSSDFNRLFTRLQGVEGVRAEYPGDVIFVTNDGKVFNTTSVSSRGTYSNMLERVQYLISRFGDISSDILGVYSVNTETGEIIPNDEGLTDTLSNYFDEMRVVRIYKVNGQWKAFGRANDVQDRVIKGLNAKQDDRYISYSYPRATVTLQYDIDKTGGDNVSIASVKNTDKPVVGWSNNKWFDTICRILTKFRISSFKQLENLGFSRDFVDKLRRYEGTGDYNGITYSDILDYINDETNTDFSRNLLIWNAPEGETGVPWRNAAHLRSIEECRQYWNNFMQYAPVVIAEAQRTGTERIFDNPNEMAAAMTDSMHDLSSKNGVYADESQEANAQRKIYEAIAEAGTGNNLSGRAGTSRRYGEMLLLDSRSNTGRARAIYPGHLDYSASAFSMLLQTLRSGAAGQSKGNTVSLDTLLGGRKADEQSSRTLADTKAQVTFGGPEQAILQELSDKLNQVAAIADEAQRQRALEAFVQQYEDDIDNLETPDATEQFYDRIDAIRAGNTSFDTETQTYITSVKNRIAQMRETTDEATKKSIRGELSRQYEDLTSGYRYLSYVAKYGRKGMDAIRSLYREAGFSKERNDRSSIYKQFSTERSKLKANKTLNEAQRQQKAKQIDTLQNVYRALTDVQQSEQKSKMLSTFRDLLTRYRSARQQSDVDAVQTMLNEVRKFNNDEYNAGHMRSVSKDWISSHTESIDSRLERALSGIYDKDSPQWKSTKIKLLERILDRNATAKAANQGTLTWAQEMYIREEIRDLENDIAEDIGGPMKLELEGDDLDNDLIDILKQTGVISADNEQAVAEKLKAVRSKGIESEKSDRREAMQTWQGFKHRIDSLLFTARQADPMYERLSKSRPATAEEISNAIKWAYDLIVNGDYGTVRDTYRAEVAKQWAARNKERAQLISSEDTVRKKINDTWREHSAEISTFHNKVDYILNQLPAVVKKSISTEFSDYFTTEGEDIHVRYENNPDSLLRLSRIIQDVSRMLTNYETRDTGTGFFDKHGKPIFIGDTVRFFYKGKEHIAPVRGGRYYLEVRGDGVTAYYDTPEDRNIESWEVVQSVRDIDPASRPQRMTAVEQLKSAVKDFNKTTRNIFDSIATLEQIQREKANRDNERAAMLKQKVEGTQKARPTPEQSEAFRKEQTERQYNRSKFDKSVNSKRANFTKLLNAIEKFLGLQPTSGKITTEKVEEIAATLREQARTNAVAAEYLRELQDTVNQIYKVVSGIYNRTFSDDRYEKKSKSWDDLKPGEDGKVSLKDKLAAGIVHAYLSLLTNPKTLASVELFKQDIYTVLADHKLNRFVRNTNSQLTLDALPGYSTTVRETLDKMSKGEYTDYTTVTENVSDERRQYQEFVDRLEQLSHHALAEVDYIRGVNISEKRNEALEKNKQLQRIIENINASHIFSDTISVFGDSNLYTKNVANLIQRLIDTKTFSGTVYAKQLQDIVRDIEKQIPINGKSSVQQELDPYDTEGYDTEQGKEIVSDAIADLSAVIEANQSDIRDMSKETEMLAVLTNYYDTNGVTPTLMYALNIFAHRLAKRVYGMYDSPLTTAISELTTYIYTHRISRDVAEISQSSSDIALLAQLDDISGRKNYSDTEGPAAIEFDSDLDNVATNIDLANDGFESLGEFIATSPIKSPVKRIDLGAQKDIQTSSVTDIKDERLTKWKFNTFFDYKPLARESEGKQLPRFDRADFQKQRNNALLLTKLTTNDAAASDFVDWLESNPDIQGFDRIIRNALAVIVASSVSLDPEIRARAQSLAKSYRSAAGAELSAGGSMETILTPAEQLAAYALENLPLTDDDIRAIQEAVNRQSYAMTLGEYTIADEASDRIINVLKRYEDRLDNSVKFWSKGLSQEERAIRIHNMQRIITAWRYFAMLGAPSTFFSRNIASNVIITGLDRAATALSTVIIKGLKNKEGVQYTRTADKVSAEAAAAVNIQLVANGLVDSIMKGSVKKYGSDYLPSKNKMRKITTRENLSDAEIDAADQMILSDAIKQRTPFGNNAVGRVLNKYYNFIFNAMDIGDKKFIRRTIIKNVEKIVSDNFSADEIAELQATPSAATKQKFNDVVEYATQDALITYFRSTPKAYSTLMNMLNNHPVAQLIVSTLFPFPRMMINTMMTAIDYSPFGLVHALYTANTDQSAFRNLRVSKQLGKAIVGSTAMIGGILLAALGAIAIDDDDEYAGPQLIVFDWIRISLEDLSPSSVPFIVGASFVTGNIASVWDRILNGADALLDATIIGELISAFGGNKTGSDVAIEAFASFINQFIPALVRQAARVIDPTKKQYSSNGGVKLLQRIAAAIPGLSFAVPGKVDPYTGKTQVYYQDADDPIWSRILVILNTILPAKVTYDVDSQVERESEAVGAGTTGPSRKYTIDGKEYTLSESKYREYQRLRSKLYNQYASALIKTDRYKNMSVDKKKKELKKLQDKATTAAKKELKIG